MTSRNGVTDELACEIHYKVVSDLFRPEFLPKYASSGAAGMDLHACMNHSITIHPNDRVRIPTGIAVQLPSQSVVALVYARSGLAWKYGLGLPNGVGVIDSDYVGEVQVLLTNFGTEPIELHPGDRVAQLVIAPVYVAGLVEVQSFRPTERGEGGFGSTGV